MSIVDRLRAAADEHYDGDCRPSDPHGGTHASYDELCQGHVMEQAADEIERLSGLISEYAAARRWTHECPEDADSVHAANVRWAQATERLLNEVGDTAHVPLPTPP